MDVQTSDIHKINESQTKTKFKSVVNYRSLNCMFRSGVTGPGLEEPGISSHPSGTQTSSRVYVNGTWGMSIGFCLSYPEDGRRSRNGGIHGGWVSGIGRHFLSALGTRKDGGVEASHQRWQTTTTWDKGGVDQLRMSTKTQVKWFLRKGVGKRTQVNGWMRVSYQETK